jgi:hypothetical protein
MHEIKDALTSSKSVTYTVCHVNPYADFSSAAFPSNPVAVSILHRLLVSGTAPHCSSLRSGGRCVGRLVHWQQQCILQKGVTRATRCQWKLPADLHVCQFDAKYRHATVGVDTEGHLADV